MYHYYMREAGYWLPRVGDYYDTGFLYRGMSYQLKKALQSFMEENCV